MLLTESMTNSYSSTIYIVAAAYGQDAYNGSTYSSCATGDTTCQVAVDSGSQPGLPNTGLMQQPLFVVPAVIALALLLVGVELLIRRYVRKTRANRKATGQSAEQ